MARNEYPATGNPVLNCLGNAGRRALVRLLRERTSSVGLRELATHLAAAERDDAPVDVPREDVEATQTTLVHCHLPRLEQAGLVEWDRTEAAVALTDHPVLRDPVFQQMLRLDAADGDALLRSLAVERCRTILDVLQGHDGEMPAEDLAAAVVDREQADDAGGSAATPGDVAVDLHHRHLPRLQQAGLVAHDSERGTVSYEGHPALEDRWLDTRSEDFRFQIPP